MRASVNAVAAHVDSDHPYSLVSLGDVGYAGYRAHKEREAYQVEGPDSLSPAQKVELRKRQMEASKGVTGQVDPIQSSEVTHVGLIMARRAVFQSIASMALREWDSKQGSPAAYDHEHPSRSCIYHPQRE